jgi:hypothetical protein
MMLTFLLERYWPGATVEQAVTALTRGARLLEEMRSEGKHVRYVHATFVPRDETVFCVVEARSEGEVAELNERAGLSFDRIAEAFPLGIEAG